MNAISEHVTGLTKVTAKIMAYSEILDEMPEDCGFRTNIHEKVLTCQKQAVKWVLMDANLLKDKEEENADEVKQIGTILLPACFDLADQEDQKAVYITSVIIWQRMMEKYAKMIKSDAWQNAKHEVDEMLE